MLPQSRPGVGARHQDRNLTIGHATAGLFDTFNYPSGIGPGVYDFHSPNVSTEQQIVQLMRKAAEKIAVRRLWVNPDCRVKTRQWNEVAPSLTKMVAAAALLRAGG
ncbi:MAG TPA: hypothetical protein VLJ11_16220 [Bryobacteraceae bacterium]|nr:hypothetical protein [Bryobacteraceae bacterium]